MNTAGAGSMLLALIAGSFACAQAPDSLSPYQAEQKISGTIRTWGSVQMGDLLRYWQKGFSKHQPGIQFENHLKGAVSAIAGIYTGVADLAISREIWPVETIAFEQVIGYRPFAIEVATGSFDVPTKSDSLEIFVHKSNPISQLTLSQLGAMFGKSTRFWSDLGLTGEWRDKPIHVYSYKIENAAMMFFRDIVLKPGAKWNCGMQEFENGTADGRRVDAGHLILEALAKDPNGIAVSNAHYASSEVKALLLAASEAGPFVVPTKENTARRTYPLTRVVYIFLNRAPGKQVDPKVKEFLRYILGSDGEHDAISEGAYLPLPANIVREQLNRLQ
jgi:phosphate transport system substrate-binding protein